MAREKIGLSLGEIMMPSGKKEKESRSFINLGVVWNNRSEVLMIKRRKREKGTGEAVLTWAFPGGKPRYDESRKECVEREVLDETGYSILAEREISIRYHPEFPVVVVYHLCKLREPEQISEPKEDWEVEEIQWVKTQEIRDLVTSSIDPKVAAELGI